MEKILTVYTDALKTAT